MKRAGWVAVGVVALVGAGTFVSWHRSHASRPAPPEARLPVGWTVDHRTADEFQRPREILTTPAPPADPMERRLCAAGLRAKARTDPAFLEQLLRDLRDPSVPREYREMAALVLGTIADLRIQHALVAELQSSHNTGWTIVLLHALGAEKVFNDDDEIFDLPDRPLVYTVAGLSLCVQTMLGDDLVRRAVTAFLSDADAEVRRAAARALIHSAEFQDLRQAFLQALDRESDEGVRSGCARALADWTSRQALAEAERRQVIASLIEAAARPGEAALRIRLEAPFRATIFLPTEEEAFLDLTLRGSPEQQLWSLSILKGREFRNPDRIEEGCGRLASIATDAKVREYAAALLGDRRTASSTARLMEILRDPAWNVRCAAARSLAGREEAKIALEVMAASDPDERVRRAASGALR